MEPETRLADLDDREVLLVLGYLAGEIADAPPEVASEDEARAAVAAFLTEFGDALVDPARVAPEDPTDADARTLLSALLADPDSADAARDLVEEPPGDDQLVLETVAAVAVVLAATISWLQTKVTMEITVEDGKRRFHFSASKDSTDPQVIANVVAILRKLLVPD